MERLVHRLGGAAAHPMSSALLALGAAALLVHADLLEPARRLAADRLSLHLDELLLTLVLLLGAMLLIGYRSQRILRKAAARRETERDAARRLASHDPLTGLLNRRGLDEALASLSPAQRRVFLIDIDGFKALNDQHGHACGDAVLQRLAARLQILARQHGVLAARLGGDEFVIVAECLPDQMDLVAKSLADPLHSGVAGSSQMTLSIGDAEFNGGGFARALERADAAMYEAKRARSISGMASNRLFEAQLAKRPQPPLGYAVIAVAINRVDDAGLPMSYGQAGPLTRAVLTEIRRVLPDPCVERLSNDVLGIVVAVPELEQVTRTLQKIEATCRIGDLTHRAKLTLGRAGPSTRLELRDAVEQAQLAVDRARRTGCDLLDFAESDRIALKANAELLRDLRAAIANDELELHFQPKLNLRTNTIDSLEALLRWSHVSKGPISPASFIPLAEESGDIRALTHWVFDAACRASATLQQRDLTQPIYVNVSALLIADEAFVADMITAARASGARIGIEVTETACLQQPQRALANLKRLADAGLSIAIDDYGVGLSSLTYLRQMPASELKIDMSFIRDLSESHRDPLIVRSTIDLAHGLDLRVTAEGVDKAETLALLKIMGCDFVQGFHIAPAHPLPESIAFLLNWTSPELDLPDYAADLRRFIVPVAAHA